MAMIVSSVCLADVDKGLSGHKLYGLLLADVLSRLKRFQRLSSANVLYQ